MQNVLIEISLRRRRTPLIIQLRQLIEMLYYIIVLQEVEVRDNRIITQQPDTRVGYFGFSRKLLDRRYGLTAMNPEHKYQSNRAGTGCGK
jgi:hypothetical protein